MMISILIFSIFIYIIGFILFSAMYCGMEFTIKDFLICLFYPLTIWFV